MFMNRDLVNRALHAVGEGALTDQDVLDKNTNYMLCKAFYLQTYLEALTEVAWAGGRKRTKLSVTGKPFPFECSYKYVYDLPHDCAKALQLQDWTMFVIEGRFLLTDLKNAELLYISNGHTLIPSNIFSGGAPGDVHELEYLSSHKPGDEPEFTIRAGKPKDLIDYYLQREVAGVLADSPPKDDYPDYVDQRLEPKFYQYLELMLAARFAMKLSNNPTLHSLLLQEAMVLGNNAMGTSLANQASAVPSEKTWTEEVLGTHNDNHELRHR